MLPEKNVLLKTHCIRNFLWLPLLSPPAPLMTEKEQCLHLSHLPRLLSNQGAAQSWGGIAFGWVVQPPVYLICFNPNFNCIFVSFSLGLQLSASQSSALAPTYVKCISAVLC